MRILVIPEDYVKDQYILEPIISAMLRELDKPYAKIRVCRQPRLHGISEALNWEHIAPIINRYKGMIDLFLLCVDRDGSADRRASLDSIEQRAEKELTGSRRFLAEHAWQEIEVWALAGHTLPRGWSWDAIRSETHPKEQYFEPFARQRGLLEEPGGGRKTLAQEAVRRYPRIRQLCPEDIMRLEERIRAWMNSLR
jgi:hypothetical protein